MTLFLGWTARSATSRAWSSLTFEHLLLVPSAHQWGNKDHQRSWSAWQHCTNVKPSPISFRWRRLSLRTKMCVQRAGYLYIAAVFGHWAKQKLIKPTMFNRTTVVLAGAVTIEAKDHRFLDRCLVRLSSVAGFRSAVSSAGTAGSEVGLFLTARPAFGCHLCAAKAMCEMMMQPLMKPFRMLGVWILVLNLDFLNWRDVAKP